MEYFFSGIVERIILKMPVTFLKSYYSKSKILTLILMILKSLSQGQWLKSLKEKIILSGVN